MMGPRNREALEQRAAARKAAREAERPWYIYGPIRPLPEPTETVEALPADEVIQHYDTMPAVYGKPAAAVLAAMAHAGVPLTRALCLYVEAQAIRGVTDSHINGQARREKFQEAKRRRAEDGWVYFLSNAGRIKIGFSLNVAARAASLSLRWTDVVAVIKGSEKLERSLHERFAQWRIGDTEWFTDCPEIRAYIDTYAEPFSAQHPAYIKPTPPQSGRTGVDAGYARLARAIAGAPLDK